MADTTSNGELADVDVTANLNGVLFVPWSPKVGTDRVDAEGRACT